MVVKILDKLRRRNGKNHEAASDPYGLLRPLVPLSHGESLTGYDLVNNIHIWGGIGSAKTTSSGAAIAISMLRAGWGGLVLCHKKNEVERWRRYAQATGREDSLHIIRPGNPQDGFNFLSWIAHRYDAAAAIPVIVETLFTIGELAERSATSHGGGDSFWRDSGRELATQGFTLLVYANQPLNFENFRKLILSGPQSREEIQQGKWIEKSYCFDCIAAAQHAVQASETKRQTVQQAEKFFTEYWPLIHDKTRTSILATLNATIHKLTGELMRGLCVAERTTFCPELCFEGIVQVFDANVEMYGEAGAVLVQALYKTMFQKAVSLRDTSRPLRPTFLFMDESHTFLTAMDWAFVSTASRENRCANIWISQHSANYEAALQSGNKSQAAVASLLGNFNHIFHANANTKSNVFAAEMIGRDYRYLPSFSHNEQSQQQPLDVLLPGGASSANEGVSFGPQNDWIFPPQNFAKFRTGGERHGFVADALIFLNGRVFESTGQNFLITEFSQYV